MGNRNKETKLFLFNFINKCGGVGQPLQSTRV